LRTVNFDDQDWEQAQGRADDARGGHLAWKLALAVAIGMVLGGLLAHVLGRHQVEAQATEAAQALARGLRLAEPSAAGARRPLLPSASEAAASPAGREAPRQEGQAANAASASAAEPTAATRRDGDLEPDATQRAAQRARERKERAWAAHYKKPPLCDENPSKDTMVECANHYIRARRQFEQDYASAMR
jgi:hypothetical protein